MTDFQVELLAPAGSKEAFLGAIHAGADAVYLAGNKYGARAYAENFTTEELVYCIRYAHIFGRKVYLTVNTLMKDAELDDLYEYLAPFYEAGLDACIVQDLGVFQCLKRWFPEMELHVSTQMTITGAYGGRFLKELGATRIVPARELSLTEIRNLKEATGLEIETFIHGAMCYCYSGQCLFSSILGGRSGNRGRCAQPCRLPYRVNTGKGETAECYPLSLKDMCTLEHIEALMEAGIDSFKIEGRMKKPEYAAGVTAIYRKYIDLKKKNPKQKLNFDKKDLEELARLYIRSERQDGYYFKQNGADMITLGSPAYSGSDEALLKKIREKYIEVNPKKKINIYASIVSGEKAFVSFVCDNLSVIVEGNIVAKAQNTPLSVENIEKQLRKLGDTCFELEELEVYTDGESFCSVKELNELRREAVRSMEDMLIQENGLCAGRTLNNYSQEKEAVSNKRNSSKGQTDTISFDSSNENGWTISISNEVQLHALEDYFTKGSLRFERIYLESELLLQGVQLPKSIVTENCYISLPYCLREKDYGMIDTLLQLSHTCNMKGFLIRNLEEYAYLKEKGYCGEIHGDMGLYIWNREALLFWKERLTGFCTPLELNKKEWSTLFDGQCFEKMTYGRIPMMITANCLAKTTDRCRKNSSNKNNLGELIDRYQKHFPVVFDCSYCMNIIYNSVPLSLHKDIINHKSAFTKRLVFTTENLQDTYDILIFFEQLSKGKQVALPFKEYTTAHEKRGVE